MCGIYGKLGHFFIFIYLCFDESFPSFFNVNGVGYGILTSC